MKYLKVLLNKMFKLQFQLLKVDEKGIAFKTHVTGEKYIHFE